MNRIETLKQRVKQDEHNLRQSRSLLKEATGETIDRPSAIRIFEDGLVFNSFQKLTVDSNGFMEVKKYSGFLANQIDTSLKLVKIHDDDIYSPKIIYNPELEIAGMVGGNQVYWIMYNSHSDRQYIKNETLHDLSDCYRLMDKEEVV
jgi:hypothetical protein